MLKVNDRIRVFATLGDILQNLNQRELAHIYQKAQDDNPWFTPYNVDNAIKGLQNFLDEEKLKRWTHHLTHTTGTPKHIGVVMAGNIPLVGIHDMLSVLITGNILNAKLSSQDHFLPKYLTGIISEIEPQFNEFIRFPELLKEIDAIIATGSDNSSRYFKYYFSRIPHIIRRNRTSCAIINGQEQPGDLEALGRDIFQYYGLGCRNVSKVFVPQEYDFNHLIEGLQPFQWVMDHHKYKNNYDYNKSVFLVNGDHHFDTGFLTLRESDHLVSPISVLYYEHYYSQQELEQKIHQNQDKIQCITSQNGWFPDSIPFGTAQQPELWDYADGVDTLEFINSLE